MYLIWLLMVVVICVIAIYKSVQLEYEYRAWKKEAQRQFDEFERENPQSDG